MKRIYSGLTALLLIAAIAASGATLWMIHTAPGLTVAQVFNEVSRSGHLLNSGLAALGAVLAFLAAQWVRTRVASAILRGVLWVAGLAAVVLAAWPAFVILSRIETVSKHLGGLKLAIRAPGYADLLLILAAGLLAGAVAFGGLAMLQARTTARRSR
jgi:hypothetical protein